MSISYISISQGRRQDFKSGGKGNIKQNFIHEFFLLYICNKIEQISVLGKHSARM